MYNDLWPLSSITLSTRIFIFTETDSCASFRERGTDARMKRCRCRSIIYMEMLKVLLAASPAGPTATNNHSEQLRIPIINKATLLTATHYLRRGCVVIRVTIAPFIGICCMN